MRTDARFGADSCAFMRNLMAHRMLHPAQHVDFIGFCARRGVAHGVTPSRAEIATRVCACARIMRVACVHGRAGGHGGERARPDCRAGASDFSAKIWARPLAPHGPRAAARGSWGVDHGWGRLEGWGSLVTALVIPCQVTTLVIPIYVTGAPLLWCVVITPKGWHRGLTTLPCPPAIPSGRSPLASPVRDA